MLDFDLHKMVYIAKDAIKHFFVSIFGFTYIIVYLFISILLNVAIWVLARFILTQIDSNMLALHYTVGFGIDYYDNAAKIFIIPLIGLFVILVNSLLYSMLSGHKDRRFLSHILFITAIFVNIILLSSAASVYLINFT